MVERDVFEDVVAVARQIVADEIKPYEGAAAIWSRLAEADDEYPASLRVFVGLASEWQDHPEYRPGLEDDIREEAQRLIDASVSDDAL